MKCQHRLLVKVENPYGRTSWNCAACDMECFFLESAETTCTHSSVRCWTHRMDQTLEVQCRICKKSRTVKLDDPVIDSMSRKPSDYELRLFLQGQP